MFSLCMAISLGMLSISARLKVNEFALSILTKFTLDLEFAANVDLFSRVVRV